MADRFDEIADKLTTPYLLGEGMSIDELDRDIAAALRKLDAEARAEENERCARRIETYYRELTTAQIDAWMKKRTSEVTRTLAEAVRSIRGTR